MRISRCLFACFGYLFFWKYWWCFLLAVFICRCRDRQGSRSQIQTGPRAGDMVRMENMGFNLHFTYVTYPLYLHYNMTFPPFLFFSADSLSFFFFFFCFYIWQWVWLCRPLLWIRHITPQLPGFKNSSGISCYPGHHMWHWNVSITSKWTFSKPVMRPVTLSLKLLTPVIRW